MTTTIQYTEDLSVFTPNPNRPTNVPRAGAIARDIAERKNMLSAYPIVVNESMGIVDGGHRHKAAMLAGVGIYYIVASGLDVMDQAKANELTKSWSTSDWAHFWAARRECANWQEYQALLDLSAEFPLINLPALLNFTMFGGLDRKEFSKSFKSGEYKARDLAAGRRLAEIYTDFRKVGLPNDGALSGAVIRLYRNPDYDHNWLIQRMKQYPRQVVRCVDAKEYLLSFQSIYNFNRASSKRVYLAPA